MSAESPPFVSPPTVPDCAPQAAGVRHQVARLAHGTAAPWLHEEVARRLADKLDAVKMDVQQWVDWSAFLGAGAPAVLPHYPQAKRWIAEPTEALAERSRTAWAQAHPSPWWKPWSRQDAPVMVAGGTPPAEFPQDGVQLVWANMTLHAATDLPKMMGQWHQLLDVNGFLMCSGLGPDTVMELRKAYTAMGWPLPTIDFIDMHDLGDEFVQAGFQDPVMDMERLTLTWASPEAMLAELRTWGGNVATGRFAGLRTPRWRTQLLDAIAAHCARPDGRVGLTLELVYGHALKPLPRPTLQPETRVSLDDMKRMMKQGKPPIQK